MPTFAVIAEHPPDLCPTSNAQTRQILKDGASQIPQLAEQLGVDIGALRIFGPDHIILAVVEANDIEAALNDEAPERLDAVGLDDREDDVIRAEDAQRADVDAELRGELRDLTGTRLQDLSRLGVGGRTKVGRMLGDDGERWMRVAPFGGGIA